MRRKKIKKNKPKKNKFEIIHSLDNFFDKNINIIFIISVVLLIIFGAFLFDVKISEGGDDSSYILRAKRFISGESFPTFQGPIYPIFLSLFILFFDVNIVILKIFSFLILLGHQFIFYYLFKNRINSTFLVFGILLISINQYILYFSSQTYSEAFYMFLQTLVLYLLVNIFEKTSNFNSFKSNYENYNNKSFIDKIKINIKYNIKFWRSWLFFGFVIFLTVNTRNIGFAALISILFILLINKRVYTILFTILSYIFFSLPFSLYKTFFWNVSQSSVADQLEIIFLKDFYNPAKGTENFVGMITRFIENSEIYLSKWISIILGLKNP